MTRAERLTEARRMASNLLPNGVSALQLLKRIREHEQGEELQLLGAAVLLDGSEASVAERLHEWQRDREDRTYRREVRGRL